MNENSPTNGTTTKTKNDSSKRPSQKLYVPKHMRNSTSTNTNESNNKIEINLNNSITKTNFDDQSIVDYLSSSSNETQSQKQINETDLISSLQSLSISSNKTKSQIITTNGQQSKETPKLADNDNENEWFNLYDEKGESLENKSIPNNINTKSKSTELETTSEKKIDYFKFEPINNQSDDLEEKLNDEQYGHVIEIYDFPISFKNENIYNAFKEHIGHQNFDIKWVDDVHCLGIFSSTSEALNALKMSNVLLKTRPLSKSGPEAKAKAQRLLNTLKPYKQRPQTTSFVASRLIGASLGINNLMSKEKLKIEKTKLDNARTKHKKDKELKEAIWQGN